jgi:flavin-dependent dehydrogenase
MATKQVVIVGLDVAGLAAAVALAGRNPECTVRVRSDPQLYKHLLVVLDL